MPRKKGLLIAPEFPADSFWSYKYVVKYVRRKAVFPPLGLLTFAAQMPQDDWEFELVDLNVGKLSTRKLCRKVQEADTVFVGAMNIQRDSLAELLTRLAPGTNTPWVLGGPMASTYRDTILNPKTESDQVLHEGLDYLVWGESQPWIEDLLKALDEQPEHSSSRPNLLIPERVLNEPDGSRKYLQERTIFRPLENMPVPRWDLLDVGDYRSMMIQTTAGCRFRCNFCDIVQFNGGFARAKDKAAVRRELQAIYDTGFTGGVFTVDDNFVSEPAAMEAILEGMIEFQRENNYPFNFFTQASVDLGQESMAHLIPLMRQAGFSSVFLGIENPDPDVLKGMNKIQNIKTKPKETIGKLQRHGIEVFAGFIYGSDGDTQQTADLIVDFVTENGIFSSMTGKLTPMPHTPLYVELEGQDRLVGSGNAKNNIDESLQFLPVMGFDQFQEGFRHILNGLFNRHVLYERARSVLERVDMHIFREQTIGLDEKLSVVRSFVNQGLRGRNGFLDGEYFGLLKYAFQRDRKILRLLRSEAGELALFWEHIASAAKDYIELDEQAVKRFTQMIDYAHEALVRYGTDKGLGEITDFVQGVHESLRRGSIALEHAREVYDKAVHYLEAKSKMSRFPGLHLAKAFELCIVGTHYQTVVRNVLARSEAGQPS